MLSVFAISNNCLNTPSPSYIYIQILSGFPQINSQSGLPNKSTLALNAVVALLDEICELFLKNELADELLELFPGRDFTVLRDWARLCIPLKQASIELMSAPFGDHSMTLTSFA